MTRNEKIGVAVGIGGALVLGGFVGMMLEERKRALHDAMRRLWSDHIAYTRLYLVEAAANLPGKDATAARLIQNQEEIGQAAGMLLGAQAGAKLTTLLKEHIQNAAVAIDAAKASDAARLADAKAKLYANADQIAELVSPRFAIKDAMRIHIDQLLSEVSDHLQRDYIRDLADYDASMTHMLALADVMSK